MEKLLPYRHGLLLGDTGRFLPYFSSHSLGRERAEVTEATIWVHGVFGDANQMFCDAADAAKKAGARDSTLVVAPWFGDLRMEASVWSSEETLGAASSTCWHEADWLDGDDSVDDEGMSSYALLDRLVQEIQSAQLPNLQRITVAGFSAGCQMVSRWALFSEVARQTTVVVGDCGTYLYLDHRRPAENCSKLENTGVHHSCDSFLEPSLSSCPEYNHYKEGLDLKHVTGNSYLLPFASDASKLDKAIDNFARTDFRLLLGSDDFCNCNAEGMRNEAACFAADHGVPSLFSGCCDTKPDSTDRNEVDFDCKAMLQGSNRLQRGLNYASHLENVFSARGVAYTPKVAFFEGMHNTGAWAERFFSAWSDHSTAVTLV